MWQTQIFLSMISMKKEGNEVFLITVRSWLFHLGFFMCQKEYQFGFTRTFVYVATATMQWNLCQEFLIDILFCEIQIVFIILRKRYVLVGIIGRKHSFNFLWLLFPLRLDRSKHSISWIGFAAHHKVYSSHLYITNC